MQAYQFQRDAADARQAASAAKVALRAVAGPNRVADDFDVEGELGFKDFTLTRNDLYRMTLENRPDVRAAEAAREKARADVNLARANAWWDVTPQLEYKRTDANEQTLGFGFSIPIRIFDRNQGEIARTRSEVNRVDARQDGGAVGLARCIPIDRRDGESLRHAGRRRVMKVPNEAMRPGGGR